MSRFHPAYATLVFVLFWALPASAQVCTRANGGPNIGLIEYPDSVPGPLSGCGFACNQPTLFPDQREIRPAGCDPAVEECTIRAIVPLEFPGNAQNTSTPGTTPVRLTWTDAGGGFAGSCGSGFGAIRSEKADAWIQTRFSCANPQGSNFPGLYTLRVRVCEGFTFCPQPNRTTTVDLTVPALDAALCLPPPKTWSCVEDDGCSAGCLGPGGTGPGASSPAGGGPGLTPPGAGPGARLRYQAGGVGLIGHPQPGGWGAQIGRYWSHDYAERIVEDPDEFHVWLMTRWATYREFTDTNMDGTYDDVSPSDEYRTLTKTIDGWELAELDGTVHAYDSIGRWASTTDRNGNFKTATFDASGRLERVDFPDGRHETFGYDGADRLTSITEVGIDGTTSRTWTLIWSAIDLERVVRPDGTAWAFRYDDSRHPGFMTRMTLVGTDGSERIEGAWEYDVSGNVTATWRSTIDKNALDVVDRWTFDFDDPTEPTSTIVIDPLGTASTYTISRDIVSDKPRIDQISGDCPTCALGPNTQSFFEDANHPMRPTRRIDGRGFETQMSYDALGMRTALIEAVGEPEERTTTWAYDATYPALVTRMERPSTTGDPLDVRAVDYTLDAAGNALDEVHEGVERGAAFSFTTVRTYTSEGMMETLDEPGDTDDDRVTYVYDPTRGSLLPNERIDPLVGSTFFGYDAFNRRTSVTDPNGVSTETAYDALDRVVEVREKGAAVDGSEDLVTEYRHTAFGDVFQIVLPRGNVLEYAYDTAGRVTSIERKIDDQPTSHAERTRFEYDAYGHRTLESHERWHGAAWVEQARTAYFYSTRCHLDRVVAGDGADQSITEYAYDCNGNLDRIWDANHPSASQTNPATTLYRYDALDRLDEVEQPFGGAGGGSVIVGYDYDVQDHLVEVVDGEGTATTYVYSDRDLLTQETSEVSGTTDFTYTADGLLETRTDARGIVQTRTYDLLDRPIGVDFPGTDLDVTQSYDDPAVDFSLGRLTRIERDGHGIDYRYDRFGRLVQDGELMMDYDDNGNVTRLTTPDGSAAVYGFDFADRPSTLTLQRPGQPDVSIVTASSYHPGGPLASLTLANGLVETREVDSRYFPDSITADLSAGPRVLDWTYTVDAVGNPTAITDALDAGNSRTYGYQDVQYTLNQADGPWGTRSWTYDRIGNRLTESADGGAVDVYSYEANSAGGSSPTLDQITLGIGGVQAFTFDAAGNQTQVDLAGNVIGRTFDDASRMQRQERQAAGVATEFRYDGRGFLRDALATGAEVGGGIFCDGFESGTIGGWGTAGSTCRGGSRTEPLYTSDGRLIAVRRSESPEFSRILYFGARPVAQVDTINGVDRILWLSTDHLGTPILASDSAGMAMWSGGFEPFGGDFAGASIAGVFLRFPGQWVDDSWRESGAGSEHYENVHRWYQPERARYSNVDPAGGVISEVAAGDPLWSDSERFSYFMYVGANPIRYADPLGLIRTKGCSPVQAKKIREAFQNTCERIQESKVSQCLDCIGRVREGLESFCSTSDRVVRCKTERTGRCARSSDRSGHPLVTCGWTVPFQKTIRLCPDGFERACGPLGCTLMHEMTHQLGFLRETKPDAVEGCLGC